MPVTVIGLSATANVVLEEIVPEMPPEARTPMPIYLVVGHRTGEGWEDTK